jgi:hypothetical protein
VEVVRPHSIRAVVSLVIQGMIEFVIVIHFADFIKIKTVAVILLVAYCFHYIGRREASILVSKKHLGLSIMVKSWIVVNRLM